jgi:hypothetical protein
LKLHIQTQIQENYGAHDWDGVGECPQYWKFKGGNDYMYDMGPALRSDETLAEIVEYFRPKIEVLDSVGFREYIIGYGVVADDYLTEFEQSQLDYEGSITYRSTLLEMK